MDLRASSILLRALPFLSAALLSCGDDEPGSNTGPERFVFSDDGRAMLWVPEGAAPSDAAITVTREPSEGELRYALEPSGLQFARPAALFVQTGSTDDGGRWLPLADLESADGSADGLQSFVWGADVMGGLEDTWTVVPVPHFSRVRVALPQQEQGDQAYAGVATVDVPRPGIKLVGSTWVTNVRVLPPADALGSIEVVASATGAVRLRSKVANLNLLPGGSPPPYEVEVPLECHSAGSGKLSLRFVVLIEGRPGVDGWVERGVTCLEPDVPPQPPPEPAAHVGEAFVVATDEAIAASRAELSAALGDPTLDDLARASNEFGGWRMSFDHGRFGLSISTSCTECATGTMHAGVVTLTRHADGPLESESLSVLSSAHQTSQQAVFVVDPSNPSATQLVLDAAGVTLPKLDESLSIPFEFRCGAYGDDLLVASLLGKVYRSAGTGDPREERIQFATFSDPIRCVAPTEPPCSATDPTMADVRSVAQLLDFALACLPIEVTSILHSAVAIGSKLVAGDHTTLRRYGTALLGASNMSAGASGPLGSIAPVEFDPGDFPCGAGPNGYTLCVDPALPAPEGPFTVLYTALGGDVPIADAVNHYQYGFVFDSDGVAGNNYQPQPQYANDFFKGTDLWYAAEYTPAEGWRLRVTDASGGGFVSIPSDARLIIQGNAMVLLVPTSELTVAMPSFRFSAFRHTGDYGLNPPYDWDGSVWPAVADGLAPFSE